MQAYSYFFLLFIPYRPKIEWRSRGVFSAFILALMKDVWCERIVLPFITACGVYVTANSYSRAGTAPCDEAFFHFGMARCCYWSMDDIHRNGVSLCSLDEYTQVPSTGDYRVVPVCTPSPVYRIIVDCWVDSPLDFSSNNCYGYFCW